MFVNPEKYECEQQYREALEEERQIQDAKEAAAERRAEEEREAGLHNIPKLGKVATAINQLDTIIDMIRDQDIQTPEEIIEQLEFMMEDLQK